MLCILVKLICLMTFTGLRLDNPEEPRVDSMIEAIAIFECKLDTRNKAIR